MATFIGLFILLLAIIGWLPLDPKLGKWTKLAEAFPQGIGTIWSTFILFVTMGILTFIGGIFLKFDLKRYILISAMLLRTVWGGEIIPFPT